MWRVRDDGVGEGGGDGVGDPNEEGEGRRRLSVERGPERVSWPVRDACAGGRKDEGWMSSSTGSGFGSVFVVCAY